MTLIELMVTLVVAAVLLGFGVPSFKAFVQKNRMASQVNTFLADLHLARSEAVKRRQSIRVCKSTDLAQCSTEGTFNNGWIVVDEAGAVLRSHGPTSEQILIEDSYEGLITFTGAGIIKASAGNIVFSADGYIRKLVISNTGRVRIQSD
ncbi:prepilin-type N-terminal cleavage/methylation domain-containing protein [Thiohalocapsa marina]|uniref:Type II secretion system protein H n=2 Tax=Thiohalocapsa marina TaxID=424902 RepID=A0A5M8FUU8_9GAMM|nr:prepilin-type N-terminal cleavage/methylation domain-containing protein [Thiohalocapsa marina]